ncbi:MAG TPA: type IV toxin-antitoxin system AbiEi family antitoxin domain-containing protein [Nocardioides sp.]|nr:type IV toxin-antitoxin system AbiEi family antitoxin domain-containing protein [Nocardioides sp.]
MVPFHIRDAERFGLTPGRVRRAAAAGLLVRPTRGTYRRADIADGILNRARAVACAVSQHHVAVDRTASWLHGVDVHTFGEHDLLPPIETCALRGHNPTRRPEVRGRTRDLLPEDFVQVGELLVTTPLRTALDLGCHLRRREAFAGMCLLARNHGFTSADLVRELPRFKRRRGVIQCRQLAAMVDPRVESHREAWTLLEIRGAGLPTPELQWWIQIDGVPTYRLDFAYVAARVCVEYDGEEFHDLTQEQRDADEERRSWLRDHGWTVIVVRRGDFTGAARERWIQQLCEALRSSYSNRRW